MGGRIPVAGSKLRTKSPLPSPPSSCWFGFLPCGRQLERYLAGLWLMGTSKSSCLPIVKDRHPSNFYQVLLFKKEKERHTHTLLSLSSEWEDWLWRVLIDTAAGELGLRNSIKKPSTLIQGNLFFFFKKMGYPLIRKSFGTEATVWRASDHGRAQPMLNFIESWRWEGPPRAEPQIKHPWRMALQPLSKTLQERRVHLPPRESAPLLNSSESSSWCLIWIYKELHFGSCVSPFSLQIPEVSSWVVVPGKRALWLFSSAFFLFLLHFNSGTVSFRRWKQTAISSYFHVDTLQVPCRTSGSIQLNIVSLTGRCSQGFQTENAREGLGMPRIPY